MKNSLVLSGSGGQGIISAGIMLAQAANKSGKFATFLPEYGPEQRGGSAKGTVTISDKQIISPLSKSSDILIAMNEQAYRKYGSQLKADGLLIVNSNRVTSKIREDVKVISVPCDDIAVEIGNPRIANVVIIGALLAATGLVTPDAYLAIVGERFAGRGPKIMEMNTIAMQKGIEIGENAK